MTLPFDGLPIAPDPFFAKSASLGPTTSRHLKGYVDVMIFWLPKRNTWFGSPALQLASLNRFVDGFRRAHMLVPLNFSRPLRVRVHL